MRREVVRYLAQRTDRLVDHIGRIVDDLALVRRALLARKRRKRHPGRRQQRAESVVQLLREARPGLLLGAEHGRKDAFVEQLPLPVQAVDVFEQLVGVHDADRQTYRDHDPQIAEPPARHVVPAGHQQLHEPLDGEQREAHDEENPHRVVLGGAYQPQGVSRGEGLDDDRNDEQDFDQHRPDYLLYCKYTIISALRQALRADGNPSGPPARAPPRRNRATRPIRRCPAPPAPR